MQTDFDDSGSSSTDSFAWRLTLEKKKKEKRANSLSPLNAGDVVILTHEFCIPEQDWMWVNSECPMHQFSTIVL